jgi:NADH:ubiquinone oxidoreductase subunit F (NADH-binding)/(2Fe-2S) ferredoxin
MNEEVRRRGLSDEVRVIQTGCRGLCAVGPVMTVYPEGIFYCEVKESDVPELVEETLIKGRIVERLAFRESDTSKALPYYHEVPFHARQMHIVLSNCGVIDPEHIDEYVARGGYEALSKALSSKTPVQIVDEVKRSGLRGRGGGGFLAGRKWEFAAASPGPVKYVVCNADEGDPGAFMDRAILEGDPHSVIEGMTLCGYAIGAGEGYVYCRAEYPLAIQRLKIAIAQATEYGLLGDNILGSSFSFKLHIKEGAGAFVCGEETALIASIEGNRGTPRPRPPYPAASGLWGHPTLINNVETFASIAPIVKNGGAWYASIGTEKSKGTKVFALAGKIARTGLVEVPMGLTLREIIFDIGGGIPGGRKFKAAQTGGPSGGCIPAEHLDLRVDYESLAGVGSIMGSGGLIVMDETSCMVDVAKYFMEFCRDESCGKCVPCRAGTVQMWGLLDAITRGEATRRDLALLEDLCDLLKSTSLCGLGQTAPNPVVSTLHHFRDEYLAHIDEGRCPAGVCEMRKAAPAEVHP